MEQNSSTDIDGKDQRRYRKDASPGNKHEPGEKRIQRWRKYVLVSTFPDPPGLVLPVGFAVLTNHPIVLEEKEEKENECTSTLVPFLPLSFLAARH